MAEYPYAKADADCAKLDQECQAAGLPVDYVNGAGIPTTDVIVVTSRDLTPAEVSTLDGVVAAHDGRPRRSRPLWAIRADIVTLANNQPASWAAIWTDLTAAVPGKAPRKYLMDYGTNAGPIFVFDWSLYVSGPTAAQQKAGQMSLVALYVQDNPSYLIHPPFDSSINIDGTEPIP